MASFVHPLSSPKVAWVAICIQRPPIDLATDRLPPGGPVLHPGHPGLPPSHASRTTRTPRCWAEPHATPHGGTKRPFLLPFPRGPDLHPLDNAIPTYPHPLICGTPPPFARPPPQPEGAGGCFQIAADPHPPGRRPRLRGQWPAVPAPRPLPKAQPRTFGSIPCHTLTLFCRPKSHSGSQNGQQKEGGGLIRGVVANRHPVPPSAPRSPIPTYAVPPSPRSFYGPARGTSRTNPLLLLVPRTNRPKSSSLQPSVRSSG